MEGCPSTLLSQARLETTLLGSLQWPTTNSLVLCSPVTLLSARTWQVAFSEEDASFEQKPGYFQMGNYELQTYKQLQRAKGLPCLSSHGPIQLGIDSFFGLVLSSCSQDLFMSTARV